MARDLQPVPRDLAKEEAGNYTEQRIWLEELRTNVNGVLNNTAVADTVPGSATASSNATKINELLAVLRTAGILTP